MRELGADPATELPVVVKEGRFGPYVTDGTTNASLRKGDDVESITMERASELLAERRAAGPSTRKKAGAKKAGRQEGRRGQEGSAAQEGGRRPRRRPARKKAAKKATGAKKAAAAKKSAAERAVPLEPF